jgi:hypothetical protein
MGAIARNAANNITTSGVFTSSAIANSSVTGITVLANASDGITFISSQTASNSASISFTSGLTSTYKAYKFVFVNIHPASEDVKFNVNFRDGGTDYDATKTTTAFSASHYENDSATAFQYETTKDLAQGTGKQPVHINIFKGSVEDASVCGTLTLFNPSSTTFVKHFLIRSVNMGNDGANSFAEDNFIAGYCNVTTAIDGVQFSFDSGNIDAGTIYLYGIK